MNQSIILCVRLGQSSPELRTDDEMEFNIVREEYSPEPDPPPRPPLPPTYPLEDEEEEEEDDDETDVSQIHIPHSVWVLLLKWIPGFKRVLVFSSASRTWCI